MALVLFDSNIIIDYLNGIGEARDELTYWDEPAISVVSWMEVRANIKPDEEDRFELLFSDGDFEIIRIDDAIMTAAAKIRTEGIRQEPKIALMDAIIKATAQVYNLTVITRNTVVVNKDVASSHAAFLNSSGGFRSGFSQTSSFNSQSRVVPVQRSG